MDYQAGLKAILDNSGTLVSWALAVTAGSVAAIVSTSYERPKTRVGRMIYLFFPVAWFFLGKSIFAGELISRRFIAAKVLPPEEARKILEQMQADFLHQWGMLLLGLTFLAGWLLLFLAWWIWYAPAYRQKNRPLSHHVKRPLLGRAYETDDPHCRVGGKFGFLHRSSSRRR